MSLRVIMVAGFIGIATAVGVAHTSNTESVAVLSSGGCGPGYYENSDGQCIEDPDSGASGATAVCRDGTYSHSTHRTGTCSGHGGVSQWL